MLETTTAERMLLDALAILQRGLPPGDLNDRQVVAELWGVFDNPAAHRVFEEVRSHHSRVSEPVNGTE
ncbi:MAG: hypothetical protein KJ944_08130 [Alphaproteobacteria bacterium]|nr:hypothetical protein [Alphaproteobacteria bacterium]MBU1561430.1 hypothetical protein [Alphaproteobacteria bacterium]MBU2302550.1 hypothetical protein [Alphaproteobacteria bacterium]MBU2367538.1 hypothetical protein [Alphaproteobacteria bacterium]